jgi:uncharacterized membrane protein
MFFPSLSVVEKAEKVMSTSEYVEKKNKTVKESKTIAEEEIRKEFELIDAEVDEMIAKKKKDLTFELEEKMVYYPELSKVHELIE